MIIGVAGPYSADTPEKRQANLDALNATAARLLEMGHTPLIGINAALPVVALANDVNVYEALMKISLAVIDQCEALLVIGESPGANRERELVSCKGLPIFYSLDEVGRRR
jgi:hypothetical protein